MAEIWGIVGGMGPLASAAFVRTVYESRRHARDQDYPRVILWSDPSYPDRTECLRRGDTERLVACMRLDAERLTAMGAARLVICCVTAHAVLPMLPAAIAERVLSLVDVAIAAIDEVAESHLMLCTEGCRDADVFQRHARWAAVADRVVWPEPGDHAAVHRLICALKSGASPARHAAQVCRLLDRYRVRRCVAACTELHLVTDAVERMRGRPSLRACVDPLRIAAAAIAEPVGVVHALPA